ncbi:Ig-like domain-containing protein [Actinoplanes friuliensis]|uniref:Uncharacterized protein n=1 Tax=Actinoplanes friuliensis DSM 7358 TaxID=1246995 RepID=U5WEG1_9ACTN|nr:Ig-like domain-containing protein [Actinoplanes friuliensis]AGZ46430.1 hypothetical protein AFR_40880 [Actinoplanes friuliensis DSM 7358]
MPALRSAPHRVLALLVVVAVGVALTFYMSRAEAVITTPFTTTFSANANGAIVLRGNTNLTCPPAATGCTDGLQGIGSASTEVLNNNGYVMQNAGADQANGLFNSSSTQLVLPAGSTVLFAGLYWSANTKAGTSGAVAPTAADKGKVKFSVPGGGGYTTMVSTETNTDPSTSAYQGYTNVTTLVAGGGNGTYSVANIQAGTGVDRYAGWALVVAYRNAALPMRDLRVFDGFGVVSSGSTSVTIPVSGFETPQYGTVTTKIGTVVYEGDLGKTGDVLQLNGSAVSDSKNPANNFFNSTVSDGGALVTDRSPASSNLLGVDVDQFDATGRLANGATSATLTLTTTNETFYPGVVTFSTDLYAPNLTATLTGKDVDGGNLLPGDEIEYTVGVVNDGTDTAIESVLTDAVPAGTTYVPGSLAVAGTPVTDAPGDDTGSFATDSAQGTTTFNIGTGATPSTGGELIPSATTKVTFRVKVDLNTPAGFTVVDVANVAYTGKHTGRKIAGTSTASGVTVAQPSADLAAGLAIVPGVVQRGGAPDPVTYQVSVTNNGPEREARAVAKLTLPAGATPGTLPAGCTATGQDVTCVLGVLALGSTATVLVDTLVDDTAAATAGATVTASGAGADPTPGNNTVVRTLTVNTAPKAVADPGVTTPTDAPVVVAVLDNDTDADGDPLTVSVGSGPAHGTAVANADGTITYTPAAGYAGPDSFTYVLADGKGGTGTATVTVGVDNAAPVVHDDQAGAAGQAVTVTVLDNDSDPNGDPLTITAVTQPASGTVTFGAQDLTFTPVSGFTGPATFTYTVSDGRGGSATATVKVTVGNAAPVAADDAISTNYRTDVVVPVLGGDTDPNGDTLTVTAVGQPGHGSVDLTAGVVTYRPAAGFSGTDTFTYTVSDGNGGDDTGRVTVTVANAAPVATNRTVQTAFGTALTLDVVAAASDPNGDSLVVSGVTAAAHGTVVRNQDGTITYTPAARWSGPDSFDYTISDGNGGTATATVSLTVANGVPVAGADTVTAETNLPLVVPVLADDSDPNGDPLTVTIDTQPLHGTAAVAADGTVTYTPAPGYRGPDGFHYTISDGKGGTAGAAVTVTVVNSPPVAAPDADVTPTDVPIRLTVLSNDSDPSGDPITITGHTNGGHGTVTPTGDGTLVYSPGRGFAGTDTFTYTIEDAAHGSSTTTVTVTVLNANPIAVPDAVRAQPGVAVPIPVLANDTDPNIGQHLRIISTTVPVHGIAAVRPDGTITYTAEAGSSGTDTFDYVVTDDAGGTDTTTVTVGVNSAPIAAADKATASSGTAVIIPVLANDTDFENEALTLVSVSAPENGTAKIVNGVVRYTPATGFTGVDTFTYVVTDPSGGRSTGRVSVTVANAAPIARADQSAVVKGGRVDIDVLGNDSDVNPGQRLTVKSAGKAAHGTTSVLSDGRIRYTPDAGYLGTDSFDYVLSDGAGGTATGRVSVTVTDGTPVALPDEKATPYQRAVTVDVLGNDLDPDGDRLTVTTVTQPADGKVTFTATTVTYRPADGFSGTAAFTYTISDGKDTSTSTVTVVVGTPPAVPDKAATADPATPVLIGLPTVDKHQRPVTVIAVGKPSHGTAELAAAAVTYTPVLGFAGMDSFSYSAEDPNGNRATGTIKVTVAGPNAAPVARNDGATVKAGASVVVSVLAGDKDPNEDPLTVTKVGKPRHGAAVLNANGTVTYAPSDTYEGGTDSFTYTISDGRGGTDTATVTITVQEGPTPATQTIIKLPRTGADLMSVGALGTTALLLGAALYFFGGRLPFLATATATDRGPGRHRPGKHAWHK